MSNQARNGAARERHVRDDLTSRGWIYPIRSAGSKGPVDLLLGSYEYGPIALQIGTAGKTLGPADRARLVAAAEAYGAIPVLAQVIPRLGIVYRRVTPGLPATWATWNPEEPNA